MTNVLLAMIARNGKRGISTLVEDNRGILTLPTTPLTMDGDGRQVASQMFRELTGRDAYPWLLITLSGQIDTPPVILYSAMIPEEVPVTSGVWMSLDEIMSRVDCKEVVNLLSLACNYDTEKEIQ